MRLERPVIRTLAVASLLFLSACGGGGGDAGSPPPPRTGTLEGTAASAGNALVDLDATATIADLPPATSTERGTDRPFSIPNVPESARVIVRVASPGHMDTVRVVAVRAGETTFMRATLLPIGATASVDTASAARITVPGSTAVLDLPANSVVRADNGAAPPAALMVDLTPIDPARDPERMPGDYSTAAGNAARNIESFGALGIQVRDSQGNRYNLAHGKAATIRIPVSSRASDLPPTIPLFYLDEATGRWVEEGTAALGGSGNDRYFEATVGHFSYWNADRLTETIFVSGCVQTQAGARAANRTAQAEGLDYSGAAYEYSNDNGEFRVAIRKDSRAALTVKGTGTASTPTIVGPAATDITLAQCFVERATVDAAPSIVAQPEASTADEFATVRFAVVADSTQPIAYQWRRNGMNIPGENGTALDLVATASNNGAVFSVVVTNRFGSVMSADATLDVRLQNAGPPRILSQPRSATVGLGGHAVFAVGAAGAAPISYQWRRNGIDIGGAAGPSYTTPDVMLADNGARFSVIVTNGEGMLTSNEATLTVTTAGAGVDLYKRPLARQIAGTYGGCTNASAHPVAPIVVTAEGDVTFEGGVIQMSSSTSTLLAQSSATSSGWIFVDPAIDRSVVLSFSSTRAGLGSVMTGSGTFLITCPIALASPPPSYRLATLALLEGTAATVSCDIQRGSTKTTETLALAISNAHVTLGALSFSLDAARTNDSVLAAQSNFGGTIAPLLGVTDFYADQSRFEIARTTAGNRITKLRYVAASGDIYECVDTRP